MKENPRKVKWTKAYRRLHGKDMTQYSTFEFERKRNRPERYDRTLADKVRVDREARHHKNRMKGKKAHDQKRDERELDQSIHLVKVLSAFALDPTRTLPNITVKADQPRSRLPVEERMSLSRLHFAVQVHPLDPKPSYLVWSIFKSYSDDSFRLKNYALTGLHHLLNIYQTVRSLTI